MRPIGAAEISTGGVKNYENDISAEEKAESKGTRLQSKNGYKVGQKGACGKTCKGQESPHDFG